jgi:hypothetical protein
VNVIFRRWFAKCKKRINHRLDKTRDTMTFQPTLRGYPERAVSQSSETKWRFLKNEETLDRRFGWAQGGQY